LEIIWCLVGVVRCYHCKGLHAWLVVPAGSWSV